ncbi:hypothetical protein [Nocardioides zeae]|uniref:Uncharacterized protein n=1 Tax=Nocardioides zeae TaxID=1457234 RepID=A0A6P0HF27_9ACTN|nr:hypothetical protein [Nocardioides zeae]NEN77329.1 hypothetical protein [Nocardioides zeae]
MKLRTLAAGAAVAAVVTVSSPAFAAGPPYTVSVGGSSAAGTHAISATSTGTVTFNARNTSGTIINMNCSSVTGSGTVTSGTGVNPVATIATTTWTGCTIPGGAATVTHNGTWNITGTGTNATTGNETIAGYVGGANASVRTTSNPNICRFTVTGQANGSFNEATQQLNISQTGYSSNLTLSNVVGCLGQLQNGNPANMVANLNVASPDGAINLS